MHDFCDLLAGGDGGQHLGADGAFLDPGDEILDDGEGDVGVQHGEADFAQGLGHVGFGQRPAFAEAVENRGEFSRQRVEHG